MSGDRSRALSVNVKGFQELGRAMSGGWIKSPVRPCPGARSVIWSGHERRHGSIGWSKTGQVISAVK
jgi:hypothetical protein